MPAWGYSCEAETLSETRVWGSEEKTLPCFSATRQLRVELYRGCENSSRKTTLGSALDNNGNTLTKNDSTGITTYGWDFENRLTSVTLPGSGGTVTFKYDPFGRRIYKSSSAGTSIYAYDDDGNLVEETNAAGTVSARYSQALNLDEPLAMLRGGTTSFYDADGLGSITSLSNTSGSIAQTYTFDSFGKQTNSSGSLTNPFQYTARQLDGETNLYFYRTRYYDPSTGRFMNEDLIRFEGGPNFYSYVRNSPVSFVDPLGLNAQPAPPGVIGQLQNLFPGSTFNGTTLVIPLSCAEVAQKLEAQGYQDSNSWGYAGPGSAFWNPFNHGGGWEWRTFGPGFHFRMPYPSPLRNVTGCGGPCLLDQFHLDQYNPLEPGQTSQHLKCDFFRACGSK